MLDPEQREGAAAAPEELELLSIPKAEGKSAVPRVVEGETIKGSPHPPAATDEAARTPGALAHDGVFSNLPARPELMQLPKSQDESPPPYTASGDASYGMLIFGGYGAAGHEHWSYDDVTFEDLEVGSFGIFLLYLMVTIFFEWVGFILCILLSQSHAAKYGSIVGLGITVALNSVTFSDMASTSKYWIQHPDLAALVSFLVAFSGYALILFGFFSYMRVRKLSAIAGAPIAFPGASRGGSDGNGGNNCRHGNTTTNTNSSDI